MCDRRYRSDSFICFVAFSHKPFRFPCSIQQRVFSRERFTRYEFFRGSATRRTRQKRWDTEDPGQGQMQMPLGTRSIHFRSYIHPSHRVAKYGIIFARTRQLKYRNTLVTAKIFNDIALGYLSGKISPAGYHIRSDRPYLCKSGAPDS